MSSANSVNPESGTSTDSGSIYPGSEVQKLWHRLARGGQGRSLAVIPSHQSIDMGPLAYDFAKMAALDPNGRVLIIDARSTGRACAVKGFGNISVASCERGDDEEFFREFLPSLHMVMQSGHSSHNAVIIVSSSPVIDTRVIPLVRQADTWVVGVTLGLSSFKDIRSAVEILGRERLAGSIVVD